MPALAQGEAAWIAKAKETIAAKEPSLKIGERLVKQDSSYYSEDFRLSKGKLIGMVEISAYRILENPEETFGGLVTASDNMSGKRETKSKIEGLGDEAYMWTGPNNMDDFTTVFFRKGKTFVFVHLPGRTLAQRVARYVVANVP